MYKYLTDVAASWSATEEMVLMQGPQERHILYSYTMLIIYWLVSNEQYMKPQR